MFLFFLSLASISTLLIQPLGLDPSWKVSSLVILLIGISHFYSPHRAYLNYFEKIGIQFVEMLLTYPWNETETLKSRCYKTLALYALPVNMAELRGRAQGYDARIEELRHKLKKSIDLMVECGVLDSEEIDDCYRDVFSSTQEQAQKNIEAEKKEQLGRGLVKK